MTTPQPGAVTLHVSIAQERLDALSMVDLHALHEAINLGADTLDPSKHSQAAFDTMHDMADRIEAEIMARPVTCGLDLAIKVRANARISGLDETYTCHDAAIWTDAMQMIETSTTEGKAA